MKIIACTLVLSVLMTCISFAQAELDALKTQYEMAAKRALEPINKVYEQSLRKLLEKYSKENDSAGVEKATEELKKLGSSSSEIFSAEKESNGTTPNIDKFFIGKSWFSPTKTEYKFDKDGSGVRTEGNVVTGFTWRKVGDLVEISGRVNTNSETRKWVFKFLSKTEGFFGDDLNNPMLHQCFPKKPN